VSWATLAMRSRLGTSMSPRSASTSPRIAANRLDLPVPLRPTAPTRQPACRARWTSDSSRRSPRRRAKLQKAIMGRVFYRSGAQPVGHVDVAVNGLHLAADRGEQARLGGAVAPDHAHPPAGVQGQVDVGQQQAVAPAQGEIVEGDHGARILPERGAAGRTYELPA